MSHGSGEDGRLSQDGAVALVAGIAAFLVALLAGAGGESSVVVVAVLLAGVVGVVAGLREILTGRGPDVLAHGAVVVACVVGVLGSVSSGRWLTAVALLAIAGMSGGRVYERRLQG